MSHKLPSSLGDENSEVKDLYILQSPQYKGLSERAAELLARGAKFTGAAALLGISRNTLYAWRENLHFRSLLEAKKEEYRQELLENIKEAGQKSHLWAANAWLLERNKVFEGEFVAPQYKQQDVGGNIVVQINVSSPRDGGEGLVLGAQKNIDVLENMNDLEDIEEERKSEEWAKSERRKSEE